MEKDKFLLVDRIKNINTSFIENGWITIFESVHEGFQVGDLIYCCIVHANHVKAYLKDRDWGIHHGREGKPSIITTFRGGKEVTTYHSFGDKGLEPFIFYKSFPYNGQRYID